MEIEKIEAVSRERGRNNKNMVVSASSNRYFHTEEGNWGF